MDQIPPIPTFASFAKNYRPVAIAVTVAIPLWIFLIQLSETSDIWWLAVLLASLIGIAEGFVLICIVEQLSNRKGREETDRFFQQITSHSAKTNLTFFLILFGFPANWYLMVFFPEKAGAYLIRTNLALAGAMVVKTFLNRWIDTWGKQRKKKQGK